MSNTTHQQATGDLLDQACEWAVRLRGDDLDDSLLKQFSDWLTSDHSHRTAFEQIANMWGDVGALPTSAVDALSPQASSSHKASPLSRWLNWRGLTGIATALVVATIAVVLIPSGGKLATYTTAKGEQLEIALQDGSTVTLNTDTLLEVDLNNEQRWLHLVRGEAWFSVANDEQRPFVVDLDGITARVLGTEFNVYRENAESALVTVTEGAVQVTNTSSTSDSAILRKHESVKYSRKTGISSVEAASANVAAWRQRQLVFASTPLNDVITTLNRYSKTPIRLISKDVGLSRVSGTFSTEHPAETARAVAEALSLEAKTDSDAIRLYKTGDTI